MEILQREFKSDRISIELLQEKIDLEMSLGKYKKALKSCKLGLFLQPACLQFHRKKV